MPIPPERVREETYADISGKILRRESGYRYEDRLPTQVQLAAAYKVSRATMARVFEDLIAARLVTTRGRLGTFVIYPPAEGTDG